MGAPFNVLPPGATDLVAPLFTVPACVITADEYTGLRRPALLVFS